MSMIRALKTIEEFQQIMEIQRVSWQMEDIEITPLHLILTVAKNGGVVLGAFDEVDGHEKMIGFVFGFLGTREGHHAPEAPAAVKLKHASHQMGVLPQWRDQSIGYALKVAQREAVRGQGLRLITWTYDPLESRNGNLNIIKLGAVCNTYLENVYGEIQDGLNRGLPTDRFQVDWWIASKRVETRLSRNRPPLTRELYEQAGTKVLNKATFNTSSLPVPPDSSLVLNDLRGLVEFPALFQDVKRIDAELAMAWRTHTREILSNAFAAGYTVTDMLYERGAAPRTYYVLTQTESSESSIPQ